MLRTLLNKKVFYVLFFDGDYQMIEILDGDTMPLDMYRRGERIRVLEANVVRYRETKPCAGWHVPSAEEIRQRVYEETRQ